MTASRYDHASASTLWSDRRRFLLRGVATIAFPMSLVDCGGGDGLVPTSAPDSGPTIALTKTPAKGTIVMPAGATVKIANVTNPFASAVPAANGTFDFMSIAESTMLAVGTGPSGGAVLYGLLQDGTAELSPRSTAVVLAYTFLGVGVYVGDMQVAYLAAIAASPSLDTLQAAVSAAIVARGEDWLQTTDTVLIAALSGVQQALSVTALTTAAQASDRAHAQGIQQNKTDRVSGLQVINDGVGAFTITNFYRRRSYAYVDRVSYKTSYGAAATASPAVVGAQPMKVNATKAITNSLATIAQFFAGDRDFYTPVVSDSIPIPLAPDTAALTSYTMMSVGLGGSAGDYGLLSDTQKNGLLRVVAETIILDFMVPIFSSIFLPARDLKSGGTFAPETLAALAPGLLKDVVDSLATSYDIIRDKIQLPIAAGKRLTTTDIADATWDVIVLAAGRDSFKNAILALFQAFFNFIGDRSSARAVINEGAKKLLDFTAALDLGLQIMDTAVAGLQIALCDVADQFTLDVTKANVKLNPLNPVIDFPDAVTFTISVIDSDLTPSTDLSYTWTSTCAFGDISDTTGHDSATGTTTFDSTSQTLTYKSNANHALGGDQDTVTGTVYLGQVHQRTSPLGKASCTITYNTPITPSAPTVAFGGHQVLTANVSTKLLSSGGKLSYKWTLTGGHGDINGAQTVTTDTPTVTYNAGMTEAGADTLNVQVVDLLNTVLTSGSTTVNVDVGVTVVISPKSPTVRPGGTATFTGTTTGTLPDSATYLWELVGAGSIGSSTSVTTATPTIGYTAPVGGTDTLSLSVVDADGKVLASDLATITIKTPAGLNLVATDGNACCGGIAPGTYTTDSVPTGGYGNFAANYAGDPQYGFVVSWYVVNGDGNFVGVSLRLGLADGTKITGTQSWTTYESILDTIGPGQFLFISSTSDNMGSVAITSFTPLAGGAHLAAFTFTESGGSPSSTRAYSGSGSFIVPA